MTENIKAITDFLFIEDSMEDIKKTDLVVVLCNNNIEGLAKVLDDLYKNEKIDENTKVIFSGATGMLDAGLEREAIRLCDKLVSDYGYDTSLFTLECEATNIYENLLFSKRLINSFDEYNNIVLIGAAFALRRIKMCAGRIGYPVDKLQFLGTVDNRAISKDDWWKNDTSKKRVFEEIERVGKYLVKGDLDIG